MDEKIVSQLESIKVGLWMLLLTVWGLAVAVIAGAIEVTIKLPDGL